MSTSRELSKTDVSKRPGELTMTKTFLATFLKTLFAAPKTVGAIAPSGSGLARLMTSEIDPAAGPVLELGPGTGIFTRALIARGMSPRNLTLVEVETSFVNLLRRRFPQAIVLQHDARRLHQLDREDFAAVVSGLPLRNMSEETIHAIVSGAFSLMPRGGRFYQFTYGQRCSVPAPVLRSLGLQARRLGRVQLNLPPASVYCLSRQG